jgi:hypothetical protein
VAAGNSRAHQFVKRVVSYLLDNPTKIQGGAMEFIEKALKDPNHPARQYSVKPVLDRPINAEFVDHIIRTTDIVYAA